jgi:hypothetical protein
MPRNMQHKGHRLRRGGMIIASYLSHPRTSDASELVEVVTCLCKGKIPDLRILFAIYSIQSGLGRHWNHNSRTRHSQYLA